jgi:RNA polymerase sigma-70 factor, ECF subfamily
VSPSLAHLLFREAGLQLDGDAGPIEQLLADGLSAARAAWPGVALPDQQFVAYLARRLPAGDGSDEPVSARLAGMRVADLYLACACAAGDARALDAFERSCLDVVDSALATMRMDSDQVQEVKQIVRRLLLVADGRLPRIVEYAGRGDLRGWVRVTAAREALRVLRRGRREVPLEADALERAIPVGADAQLEHLKAVYRGEFRAAFGEAMAALSQRERNLLGHQFADGLTLDQIAALYRVHRATVARWLGRARTRLLRGTRAALRGRLRVPMADLDSIMRLIESRLEVTLPQVLRGDGSAVD